MSRLKSATEAARSHSPSCSKDLRNGSTSTSGPRPIQPHSCRARLRSSLWYCTTSVGLSEPFQQRRNSVEPEAQNTHTHVLTGVTHVTVLLKSELLTRAGLHDVLDAGVDQTLFAPLLSLLQVLRVLLHEWLLYRKLYTGHTPTFMMKGDPKDLFIIFYTELIIKVSVICFALVHH